MLIVFTIYTALVAFYLYKSSSKGTFYLFSPLIVVHLHFVFSNIYPLVVYEGSLPQNIINVTLISCIVNLFFLIKYQSLWHSKVIVKFPREVKSEEYSDNRLLIIFLFVFLIFISGFITGVTPSLLSGVDVEDLRRSAEVGVGFIREIPSLGLPILILEYFLLKQNISIKKVIIITLLLSLVYFMATGHRRGVAVYLTLFLVWYNFRHRNFKWYEYFVIFYLIQPIFAAILTLIRNGSDIAFGGFTLLEHETTIFNVNTVLLARWIESSNFYLMGYSYFYSLVFFIPRFLWPGKPVSIDYYYKKNVGLDFEGGGIYTTNDFDLFMNFGYYYIIPYIIYLLIPHYIYGKMCKKGLAYDMRLFFIVLFTFGWGVSGFIKFCELYFLFLILFFVLNRKWRYY